MSPAWGESDREARLYVSALGVYDARVDYLTYDVTHLVAREPAVTLAAVLGNGWYNGRISDGSTYYSENGNALALKAKLLIRYADGTTQSVVTRPDGSWKATLRLPAVSADTVREGRAPLARVDGVRFLGHSGGVASYRLTSRLR
ncbi:alpha-rhamnosidase [Streptomyces lincolnensis]|uniref:Alpha-rhamnosidase n=1 Tax=Streptomyces lincolnensis TaxID=1915 RepID=A0A1B1M3H0_STRLN|nr:alpha-rhamnosidase [Streptomyces lincolnensis]AXG51901.1 alpha-rhamnosidase [Streptomyces lincolnensis]